MNKTKRANPLWETIVLFASFALLWLWFLATQAARNTPEGRVSPIWQVVLGVALLVLVYITARRINRVKRAFSGEELEDSEDDEDGTPTGAPPLPFLPPNDGRRR